MVYVEGRSAAEPRGSKGRMRRRAAAGALAVLLAAPAVPCAALADEAADQDADGANAQETGNENAAYKKDESVYGVLSFTGAVENLYVVNQFDVSAEGRIIDFGMYDAVENLTNHHRIDSLVGEQTFAADEGLNYYRGTIENGAIPWNIDIGYSLNGESVSVDRLPGAEGAFCLSIATSRNDAFETSEFFEHYMLQISFTVPADKLSAIDAGKGGIVADAGANKQITYTVMPNEAADLTFRANVTDFEMGALSIAAAPFSMDVDGFDTDEMVSGMQDLADAVQEVADGTTELRDGTRELSDGVVELSDGTVELADGTREFASGVSELASGTKDLPSGLRQLAEGADQVHAGLDGLVQMLGAMEGAGSRIDSAIASVDESIAALEDARDALVGLQGSFYETIDIQDAGEDEGASAIGPTIVITRSVDDSAVDAAVARIDAKLADLVSTKQALLGARSADAQATAVGANVSPYAIAVGLRDGASGLAQGLKMLADQMPELVGGIDQLAAGAADLADGTSELASGTIELSDGTNELADGVDELDDGMQEFAEETADLPQQMQDGIDEAMAEYQHDFDPVSFASPFNGSTEYVQFAFTVRPIELPDETVPVEKSEMPGFFERVAALFSF